MNKQEKEDLIQALYDIGGCDAEDEWSRGYDDGVNAAIDVIKELKVQEKAIVPKFVAIELDKLKAKYLTLRDVYTGNVHWLNNGTFYLEGKELELANWLNKNETTFEYAWIHGYEVEKEPTIHELKILPEYFEAVVSGNKRFEIRKNDRNYKKGDILRLNEYQDGQYTGDVHVAEITYITDYAQQEGYVVLGIK
ncbi:DUF3850 domain-containing protein [Enterococcus faecalis]|uniref:DUF3850 domain-containing protein n=1 Tax=Enterococcus faecalis TaxID=1351 RepID=UPI0025985E36|nr:DUF3850 domain-containing protein [Enterococcus faecalis]MDM3979211.1 DUF3850 domain-containing protein [Enterococcus faecalis]